MNTAITLMEWVRPLSDSLGPHTPTEWIVAIVAAFILVRII